MLKYCLDSYNTQQTCDKAADSFLPTLKFVTDWFVTDDAILSNDDIVFGNEDSGNATFSIN